MDKKAFLSLYDKASPSFVAAKFDFICAHSRFFSPEAIGPSAFSVSGSASEIQQALLSPRKVISQALANQNLIRFKNQIKPLARIEIEEQKNVFKFEGESGVEDEETQEQDSEAGRVISLGEGEHRIIISLETLGPNPNFSFMAKERRLSQVEGESMGESLDESHFLDKTKEQIGLGDTEEETEFERLVRLGEESSLRTQEESKFSDQRIVNEIGNILERKFVILYLTDHEEVKSEPMVGPELMSFFNEYPNIERFLVNNIFRNQVYDSFYFKLKILPIIKHIAKQMELPEQRQDQVLKDIKIPQADLGRQEKREESNSEKPREQILHTVKKPQLGKEHMESPNRKKTRKKNSNDSLQSKEFKLNEGSQHIQLNLNKNLSSISPSGLSSGSMVNSSLLNLQFPPNKKLENNSSGGSGSKRRTDRSNPRRREQIFLEYGELGVQPNWKNDSGKSKNSRRSRSSKRSDTKSKSQKYGFGDSKGIRSKTELGEGREQTHLPVGSGAKKPDSEDSQTHVQAAQNINTKKKAGFLLDLLGKPLKHGGVRKKKLSDPIKRPLRYKGEFRPTNISSGSKSKSKEGKRTKQSAGKYLPKQVTDHIQSPSMVGQHRGKAGVQKPPNPARNQPKNTQNFRALPYAQNKLRHMMPSNPQNKPMHLYGRTQPLHLSQQNRHIPGHEYHERMNPQTGPFQGVNQRANRHSGINYWGVPHQQPAHEQQRKQIKWPSSNVQSHLNKSTDSPYQVPFNKLLHSDSRNFFFEYEKMKLQKKSHWGGNSSQMSGSLIDSQNALGRGSNIQKLFPEKNINPRQQSRWDFVHQVPQSQSSQNQRLYSDPSLHQDQMYLPNNGQQESLGYLRGVGQTLKVDAPYQDPHSFNNSGSNNPNYKTPHRKSQLLFNSQNQKTFLNMNTPTSNYYSPVPSPLPGSLFGSRPLFGRASEAFLQTPVEPEISDTASMNTTSAFRLRLPNNLWKQPSPERFPKRQIEQLLREDSELASKKNFRSEGNGSLFFGNAEALEMQTVDLSEYQSHFKDDRRATLNILPDSGLFKGLQPRRNVHKGSDSSIGSLGMDSHKKQSFFGFFQPKPQHRGSMAQLYTSPNPKLDLNRKASLGFRETNQNEQKRASTFLDNNAYFESAQGALSEHQRFSVQNLANSQKLNNSGYQAVTSVEANTQKTFGFGLREIQEKNEMAYLQSENDSCKGSKHHSPYRKVSKELGKLLNPISEARKSQSKNTQESQSKSGKVPLFGRNSGMISGEFKSFEDPDKNSSLFKFLGSQKLESDLTKKKPTMMKSHDNLKYPKREKNSEINFKEIQRNSTNMGTRTQPKTLFNFGQMRKDGKYPLTPDARLRGNVNRPSVFSPKMDSPQSKLKLSNQMREAKSNTKSIFGNLKKKRISLFKENAMMISANPVQITSTKNPFLQGRKTSFAEKGKPHPNAPVFYQKRKQSTKIAKIRKSSLRPDLGQNNIPEHSPKTQVRDMKRSSKKSRFIKKPSKFIRKKSIANFPLEPRNSNKFVFFPIRKLSSRLSKSKSKSKNTSKSPMERSNISRQEEMMATSIDSGILKMRLAGERGGNSKSKKGGTHAEILQYGGKESLNRSSKKIRKFSSATRLAHNKSHFSKSPNRGRGIGNQKILPGKQKLKNEMSKSNEIFSKEIDYAGSQVKGLKNSGVQTDPTAKGQGDLFGPESHPSNTQVSQGTGNRLEPKSNTLFNNLDLQNSQKLDARNQGIHPQKVIKVPSNFQSLFNQTYHVQKDSSKLRKYGGTKNPDLKLKVDLKKSIYSVSGVGANKPPPMSPMTQHTVVMPSSDSQNMSLFKPDYAYGSKNLMKMPLNNNPKWSDYANMALMKISSQARMETGLFSNLKPTQSTVKSGAMYPGLFPAGDPRYPQRPAQGHQIPLANFGNFQHNPFVKPFPSHSNYPNQPNTHMNQEWNRFQMGAHGAKLMDPSLGRPRHFEGTHQSGAATTNFRTYPSNSFLETDMQMVSPNIKTHPTQNSLFKSLSSAKTGRQIPNAPGNHLMLFLDRKGSTLQRNYESQMFSEPKVGNQNVDLIPSQKKPEPVPQSPPFRKLESSPVQPTERTSQNKKFQPETSKMPDDQIGPTKNSKTTRNNKKQSSQWREYDPKPKNKRKRRKQQKYVKVDEKSRNLKNSKYSENENKISYRPKHEGNSEERPQSRERDRRRRNRNRDRRTRRNH